MRRLLAILATGWRRTLCKHQLVIGGICLDCDTDEEDFGW